ncbi:glycoside hydrolase family 3 C-terminal domain-containing protein, partial [Microbispora rosea]|uniref:glycoside hydrolase family 3 C-terminal domain-containing protein n=1 Tax=Microbispora rosea TaxID=58117 RepID=UPI0034323E34
VVGVPYSSMVAVPATHAWQFTKTLVAVIGPCADDPQTLLGCYAFPNHVLDRFPDHGMGLPISPVLDLLRTEFPDSGLQFARGTDVSGDDTSGIAEAAALAGRSDLALLFVGDRAGLFGNGTSGEGCDAAHLALPGVQPELVEAVLATGTPTVLVVVSGRPYAVGPYVERAAAALQAFLPGVEGGTAIAGVLSGRVEPSGRLPVQIPGSPFVNPSTYLQPPLGLRTDGISVSDPTPAFPFGHGLSYTTVTYDALTTSTERCPTDGTVEARVSVTNTGSRTAEEVVQLYASDPLAQVARPVAQLVGFARVPLAPGQTRDVVFEIPTDAFSYTDPGLRRIVEPGVIALTAGPSAADRPLRSEILLTGDTVVLGRARRLTTHARVPEPAS